MLSDSTVLYAMLTGWAGLAAAAISPGPNMFAVVSSSLGGGIRQGLQVNLGIAIGAFIWAILATLGLASILIIAPAFLYIFTFLGASYLLYLAYKAFKSSLNRDETSMVSSSSTRSLKANILHGLGVTFSNPKVALFWVSISSLITAVTTNFSILAVFAIGASIVVFIIYGTYSLAFSTNFFRLFYQRFRRFADAFFGVTFTLLAFRVLYNLRNL